MLLTDERAGVQPGQEWVVGFLFDDAAKSVILIRKRRPTWQAGKLNGVGGKVEPGETIYEAMSREFWEETRSRVEPEAWTHFLTLEWSQGLVHFFRAFDGAALRQVRSVTDEPVECRNVGEVFWASVIPNLRWIVPLAAQTHDEYETIRVVER